MHLGFYQSTSDRDCSLVSTVVDDCFVFASVTSDIAPKQVAEACDMAILVYNILKYKRFYIEAPAHLIMQQLKNVNRIFKKTHASFACGSVCLSKRKWWGGCLGEVKLYIFKEQLELILPLPREKPVNKRLIEDSMGLPIKRNQGIRAKDGWYVAITKSIADEVNLRQLQKLLTIGKKENLNFNQICERIVLSAQKRRQKNYYAAAIFQRNP